MNLKLDDFSYDLPEEQIAKYPTANRGDSKLLFYQNGVISHHKFPAISSLVPAKCSLFFNDTKVIPARILLSKETGARIEIFLLEPIKPSSVHEEVMNAATSCAWKCMIGNAKKWKIGSSLSSPVCNLEAHRSGEDEVTFTWEGNQVFSEILGTVGNIPLPPYLNREVEDVDQNRYQTIYSKSEGAVAAPTAGLHFTEEILGEMSVAGIETDYLTLHVSAGTFQPIKVEDVSMHPMHNEQIWLNRKNIENLLKAEKVIAVGTTAMRTIESLYWFGVKLSIGQEEFFIRKEDAYSLKWISKNEALETILKWMQDRKLEVIGGQTEIFIHPGYDFKLCNGLVTNYHLPRSTLILLVAAFIGEDWKKVYEEALKNNYRFLSYGDSSLLMRD